MSDKLLYFDFYYLSFSTLTSCSQVGPELNDKIVACLARLVSVNIQRTDLIESVFSKLPFESDHEEWYCVLGMIEQLIQNNNQKVA